VAGEDYVKRPTSTYVFTPLCTEGKVRALVGSSLITFPSGLVSPVNEIKIVKQAVSLGPNAVGEVWMLVRFVPYLGLEAQWN